MLSPTHHPRRLWHLVALSLLAVVASWAVAVRGSAAPCLPAHCYIVNRGTMPGIEGADFTIQTGVMSPPPSPARMQNEGWVHFANGGWVESGTTIGYIGYGGGTPTQYASTPRFFMAYAPNGDGPGFQEWDFDGGPYMGQMYSTQYWSNGSGGWCVFFGGSQFGCGAPFTVQAQALSSGLEFAGADHGTAWNAGFVWQSYARSRTPMAPLPSWPETTTPGFNWCYRHPVPGNGSNSLDWGTVPAPCPGGYAPSARMAPGSGSAAATPAEAARARSGAPGSPKPLENFRPSEKPRLTRAALQRVADDVARANVTSRSRRVETDIRTGTLASIADVIAPESELDATPSSAGHRAWLDQDAAVITLEGDFVLDTAPRPPGAKAPRGSVMHVVIDERTGEVRGTRVDDQVPDGLRRMAAKR